MSRQCHCLAQVLFAKHAKNTRHLHQRSCCIHSSKGMQPCIASGQRRQLSAMSFNLCCCSTALGDKRLVVSMYAIHSKGSHYPDEPVMDQTEELLCQEEQWHGHLDLDFPPDANETLPWSWSWFGDSWTYEVRIGGYSSSLSTSTYWSETNLSGVKGAQDVLDDQSPSLSLAFLWIILDRTLDYYSVALGLLDSSQLTMQVVFTP